MLGLAQGKTSARSKGGCQETQIKTPELPDMLPGGCYVYRIDVSGVPRYVGSGVGDRAWQHFELAQQGSQVPFHIYLAQGVGESEQVSVHIIKDCLSKQSADLIETSLIDSYGRFVLGKGTLLNLGDGGKHNGQRMHTVRAHHEHGLNNPLCVSNSKRQRPPKEVRELRNLIYGTRFGSKRQY